MCCSFFFFFFFSWIFIFFFSTCFGMSIIHPHSAGERRSPWKDSKCHTLFLLPATTLSFNGIFNAGHVNLDFFPPSLNFHKKSKQIEKRINLSTIRFATYEKEQNIESGEEKKLSELRSGVCVTLSTSSPCPNSLVLCSLTRWIERVCLLRRSYIPSF